MITKQGVYEVLEQISTGMSGRDPKKECLVVTSHMLRMMILYELSHGFDPDHSEVPYMGKLWGFRLLVVEEIKQSFGLTPSSNWAFEFKGLDEIHMWK